MKKITLSIFFITLSFVSFSQSIGYEDLALLFSSDDNLGSARFNAMSGAFGALGGDISAFKINPAGAAVFNNGLVTTTGSSRTTKNQSLYYGNKTTTQDEYFNLSQAGGVFVYRNYVNKDWSKFSMGFNFSIKNDFRDYFIANGNSGFSTFNEFPLDTNNPKTQYDFTDSQRFINTYNGELSEYNFVISALYKKDLYVGFSINTFDLKFSQNNTLTEKNNDGNGNVLNARYNQQNYTLGTGFSLNAGLIYKASKYLRLGFSYQTPTWFTEINEETNIVDNDGFFGDTTIFVSNDTTTYDNTLGGFNPRQNFSYKLKTPGVATASAAFIFGSWGLISADYSYKTYNNMKLSNDDFSQENEFFLNNLRNTYTLKLGTEWRLKSLSIRGGYLYEQSPDKFAIESDNIKGYSFGAGYSFGNVKFDISYQNKSRTQLYDFYQDYSQVKPSELTIDNKIMTASITINL